MNIRLPFFIIIITFYTPVYLESLDLSLENAKEYTRNNSESIRLKLLEINEKKYALKVAEARRLPELKMQASASYLTDPPEGITIPRGAFGSLPDPSSGFLIPLPMNDLIIIDDPENTYFKLTTTLTQPVFTWNKINNAIKIARTDVDVSELTYENIIS
ncbi:MAG: TolC family protein, partial [Spirochaetales bacterium]|nr:TolC family protein [Spirochaetales bacterium]